MAARSSSGRCRCLVLGGTGAIGSAVTRALARHRARVCFTFHEDSAGAEQLAGSEQLTAMRLDLASFGQIDDVVERARAEMGGLDALVQCAGVGVTVETGDDQRVPQISEAAWDRMIDVNLKGTFFACRAALPIMRAGGGGNIVCLGSLDGVKPMPSPVHWSAAKGGLGAMVRSLAKEVGRANIRVNLVAPGILERGISRAIDDDLRREYLKHCGLRRVGRVDEVAGLVAWLALENTYLTGQSLAVDGAL